MPFFTPNAYVGLAVEATRGTPIAPATALWMPTDAPEWTPSVTWLDDKSLRGSAPDIYSAQAGVRHDTVAMKGMVYLDTFPNFLRAILGSTDTVVAAPTATTLTAAATAGAASISTEATIASGSSVVIALTNGTFFSAVTGTPSGAGPFTIPITPALPSGASSGAAVTGLTKHTLSLLNSVSAGSQPPSYTIEYFTGGEAGVTSERQFAGGMCSDLSMTFSAEAALAYSSTWMSNAAGSVTSAPPSFSNEFFVPAWSCAVQLNGSPSAVVLSGEIDMKRGTEAIHTLGQQGPYRIWDGPLGVTGKLSFVVETGDLTIVNGTTRVIEGLDFLFTEPVSQHTIDLHMSQVQLRDPKLNFGKSYVQVDANFTAEGNTTDAVGGGYANLNAVISNSTTVPY